MARTEWVDELGRNMYVYIRMYIHLVRTESREEKRQGATKGHWDSSTLSNLTPARRLRCMYVCVCVYVIYIRMCTCIQMYIIVSVHVCVYVRKCDCVWGCM